MARLLDFVIVGAQKSGTTHLVTAINASRQAHACPQEIRCFRNPFYPDFTALERYIADAPAGLSLGIKHPAYLASEEAPARLHDYNPQMRILAILRDPVERAISSYLHFLRNASIPCIHPDEGLMRAIEQPDASPKYRQIIEFSKYAAQCARYAGLFDPDRVLFFSMRQYLEQNVDTRLGRFLGAPYFSSAGPPINVGSHIWEDCVAAHRRSVEINIFDEAMNVIGRRKPVAGEEAAPTRCAPGDLLVIDPGVRAALAEVLREDVEFLERLEAGG